MLGILQSLAAQLIDFQLPESSTSDAPLARGPRDLGMRRGRGLLPQPFLQHIQGARGEAWCRFRRGHGDWAGLVGDVNTEVEGS